MSRHQDKKTYVAGKVARLNGHAPVPERVPSLKPTRPWMICPGAESGCTLTVKQIAPTVQRRRHRHAIKPAQAAAAE